MIDTSNFIKNVFSNEIKIETPITNILAKNGKFQVRQTPVITSIIKDDNIFNELPEMQEGIKLNIPKIPFEIFNYMGTFFKKIYEKEKTESALMVFYNDKDSEFIAWAPEQKISSANVTYKRDDDPEYVKMCTENLLVMVAHSHPWKSTAGPSPSGTDNNDEKESLLYMILGNVEEFPTYTISTCPNGKRTYLSFNDIFEIPSEEIPRVDKIDLLKDSGIKEDLLFNVFIKNATDEELNEFFEINVKGNIIIESLYNPNADIPEEWFSRCKKDVAVKSYNYNYNYNYSKYNKPYKAPAALPAPSPNYETAYRPAVDKQDEDLEMCVTTAYDEYYKELEGVV